MYNLTPVPLSSSTPLPTAASADRNAWSEPGVYQAAPGVHRIPLPLPGDALRAVNVYALEDAGRIVLIDSGWHRADSWEALGSGLRSIGAEVGDVAQVLVTHIHHDHYGQAARLRLEAGASVTLGAGERRGMEVIVDLAERARSWAQGKTMLRRHGAPALAEEWQGALRAINEHETTALWEPPDVYLDDAAVIETGSRRLRVIATPGHTRGHVSLLDEENGIFFTGDHVLPHITPSIGVEVFNDGGALVEFLMSLARVWGLPADRVLPAHGPEFTDLTGRVDELLGHHGTRLAACIDAVRGTERTAAEVATILPWTRRERRFDELDLFNKVLAVNEAISHLELLRTQGTMITREVDDVVAYRLAT